MMLIDDDAGEEDIQDRWEGWCGACGGTGVCSTEERVTAEMAHAAGDPDLEGCVSGWTPHTCLACAGSGIRKSPWRG